MSSFKGEMIVELLDFEFILEDKGKVKRRQAERLGICFCFCMEAWQIVLFKI